MELTVIIGSILRHALSALGAYLVAKGYVDADTVGGLVEQAVGGVLAVGTVAWSVFRTKKLAK
jgi:hypothetical protein